MINPHSPLDWPVANALVAGDHDQALGTDGFEPLVVQALPRYLGKVGVARKDEHLLIWWRNRLQAIVAEQDG